MLSIARNLDEKMRLRGTPKNSICIAMGFVNFIIILAFLIVSISKYEKGEYNFQRWNNAESMPGHQKKADVDFESGHARVSYSFPRRNVSGSYARELYIVVGIPTVKRIKGVNYLVGTLDSLIRNRSFSSVVFVVLVADIDKEIRKQTTATIEKRYAEEVKSGLIQIIYPPDHIYPNWDKELKLTFGDSRRRVKWRSKHNIDESYLMKYAYSLNPKYYLMLEDDVTAVDDYLNIIYKHAESSWREDLFIISYCKFGAIGKLISGEMLPLVSDYLRVLWSYKPIDWLISDLLFTLACGYPRKDCDKEISKIKIDHPDLFKHKGKISSSKNT
uniref:alpha-1,3-mannosyl-glycoprotein 4-beta-N-acetylglucosaminyltransferase A-like n=1 Tax=Styela clava TaxID=7725 RepID=UPI00193A206C|nr:alpha-1,3-mannosyl-glycoprotein 4-beta-N-acetylglucosaminyltransferase A-like [Styela clava]